jgi:hypothetical protein
LFIYGEIHHRAIHDSILAGRGQGHGLVFAKKFMVEPYGIAWHMNILLPPDSIKETIRISQRL